MRILRRTSVRLKCKNSERVTYFDGTHAFYVGGIFNQLFEILAEEYISLELQREVLVSLFSVLTNVET